MMQASPAQQGAPPERSVEDAQELMKQIVARMPTDKADVFAYPIAWAAYDGALSSRVSIADRAFECAARNPPRVIYIDQSGTRADAIVLQGLQLYLLNSCESTRSTRSLQSIPCSPHRAIQAHAELHAHCCAGIGPEGKKKMSQWVTKTIKELLGEEEQTLVRAASNVSFHVARQRNACQPASR